MAALLLGIPYYTIRSNSLSSVKFLTNYYFSGNGWELAVGRVSNALPMCRRFSFSLSMERRICWSALLVISAHPLVWTVIHQYVSLNCGGHDRDDDSGICNHRQLARCRRFQWLHVKHVVLLWCSGLTGSVS